MLTISKPLSASKARAYHAREFVSIEQNYWSRGGTSLGQWHGSFARELGLSGVVLEEHFSRLAEGQHPFTGTQLVQHRMVQRYRTNDQRSVAPVEHRAGWDATFSAPKSVSLTALVGWDDRVREAHRSAVRLALTELEQYTQARMGGNRPAQTTRKLVAATFEHDTARPVDGYAAPQLHTHAVLFNMTQLEDLTHRSLQPQSLFDSQQFATAVYQSELTYRLRGLGYEIEPGRSGAPEIKGYTQEYLDASSPRSQQIREYLKRNGFQGAASAQIAAHSTRDGKQIHTADEVLAAHRRLARDFGQQADVVVAQARARVQEQAPEASRMAAQAAVTFARERSFEREASSDERALLRDALRRGISATTYAEIRSNFEQRIAAAEFLPMPKRKHATGREFTTAETVRAEKQILHKMREGQSQIEPIMSIQQAVRHTTGHPQLNDAQRRAAEEILTSRDIVQGLQGSAGVGKSTALRVVREAAESRGYIVEGFAPTSRAAQQLRDVGISADTLQGFLARTRPMTSERHLYMLDESSLASTKQVRDFLFRLGSEDRVLFIGDIRQHQGVEAGKPFEQLVQAGMRTVRLDQIVRQKDPGLLRAVEFLSSGDVPTALALLEEQGRVTEITDSTKRIAAIAHDYAQSPELTLIVSPDNASRREINQAVRRELQAADLVSREDYPMRVLVQRSDLTGADRGWSSRYAIDDIIHYQRGSRVIGIEKKSYARVVAIDPAENLLTVRTERGARITYDPSRLVGISAYREIERSFAEGDRLQFTAPNRELGVANRDLGTVQHIEGNARLLVRLDSGKSVSFDATQMRHFDHGYAVTSHSSQGLTAKRVLVNIDTEVHPGLMNNRFAYVSVSRAVQDAQIYTNAASSLAASLSRTVTKSSALDLGPNIGV